MNPEKSMGENRSRRWVAAAMALVLLAGCRAHQAGPGLSAADLNQLSASSAQSADGSRASADSSADSNQSSENSSAGSKSGQSSGDSSKASTPVSSAGSTEGSDASTRASEASAESSRLSGGSSEGSSKASDNSSAASGSKSTPGQSVSSGSNSNTTGLLASTATLAVTVGVIGLAVWMTDRSHAPPVGRAAHSYLKANALQLRQDLALGSGRTIEDLAAAAEIRPENLGRFARILQANRGELWAMGDPSVLSPDRALRLLARVGELAKRDPALHADYLAFLARRSQGS